MESENHGSVSNPTSGTKTGASKQGPVQDMELEKDGNRSNDAVGMTRRSSKRRSKKEVTRKQHMKAESNEYNLQPVGNAPRLNGGKLRFLVWISDTRLFGKYVVNTSFRRAKFYHFRTVHLSEEPTFFPNPKTFDGTPATPEKPCQLKFEKLICEPAGLRKTDFRFFSIHDYYDAYRKRITTPEKVAEWVIARVKDSKSSKPKLGAVTQMDEDSIRENGVRVIYSKNRDIPILFDIGTWAVGSMKLIGETMAENSTRRFGKSEPLSFLDGVPVLIKEEINCVPYKTRCGTKFLGELPVEEDSTIARKLKEAGAIIIGLSNMHELGMGVLGYNIHLDNGMPRNPYNPQHFTGGSSSGSAAAVAAGIVPVAIGTDGGGSVRIPATLCGNVGLKPTFGRVSFGGNEESCHSVVHAGPICSNVNDAALVYALLAGPDPKDPLSENQPLITLAEYDSRKDLKDVRIGVDWKFLEEVLHIVRPVMAFWGTSFHIDSDPEVARESEDAIEKLREAYGATIVNINIPELHELRIAHTLIILSEMRESFNEHYENHLHDLNPENQTMMRLMRKVTATDYIGANKQRTRAIHFFKEIFKTVDIIVTPACGQTAPKIERGDEKSGCTDLRTSLQVAKYMLFGNLTGLPGLVVPIAYSEGLPIGLQITGKWWEEDLVLAVGKFTEKILQPKKEPEIFFKNECLIPPPESDHK